MCIAVFIWKSHLRFPFFLLLNRDEYHDRPTTPLAWWDGAQILGGRDAQAGGTWLACSRNGRLAFLTNVRETGTSHSQSQSQLTTRGSLPVRFLHSKKSPTDFAEELVGEVDQYNGFNLLVADLCSMTMVYITNRPKDNGLSVTQVSPGIHVLSNAKLDSPWPKRSSIEGKICSVILNGRHKHTVGFFTEQHPCPYVLQGFDGHAVVTSRTIEAQRLRSSFEDVVEKYFKSEILLEEMAESIMNDTTKDDERELPGIYSPEFEYPASAIFVEANTPLGRYGTRSTSAVSVKNNGEISFYERSLEKQVWREQTISYHIEKEKIV